MQKINFQNLPSTTTPINATNLNAIQTNVENVFNGVEPTGSLVVDNVKTKNLFNKRSLVLGDITGGNATIRISSRQNIYLPAGTYTFSTNLSSTFQYILTVQTVGVPPLVAEPSWTYINSWGSASSVTFTLTTGGYFCIYLRRANNSSITLNDIISFNYQLEKGSSATTFKEYQELNMDFSY